MVADSEIERFFDMQKDIVQIRTNQENLDKKLVQMDACTKNYFKEVFNRLRVVEDFKLQIITVVVVVQVISILVIATIT